MAPDTFLGAEDVVAKQNLRFGELLCWFAAIIAVAFTFLVVQSRRIENSQPPIRAEQSSLEQVVE